MAKEYIELKEKIKWSSIQSWLSEEKIYNEIYTFFKQYYSNGDFVKNKKQNGYYKEKGWDVMFSWATKDQYYIKSWNLLSGYSFYVWKSIENSETGLKEFLWIDWIKKVQFEVVDSEMEKSGEWSKEQTRKFIFGGIKKVPLSVNVNSKIDNLQDNEDSFQWNEEEINETEYREEKDFYLKDNGETLVLLFEYKSIWEDYKNEKWDKISLTERNVKEIGRLFEEIDELNEKEELKKWLIEEKARGSSGGELKLGNIESNLEKWESNIGSDFFIHKNLKGFLEEELEYFIKEKLVGSDIILQNNGEFAERYLKKIRVLKEISEDIIDFLGIIEDFQKKLWEKKPLVLDSNYCITLWKIIEFMDNDKLIVFLDELILEKDLIDEWNVNIPTNKIFEKLNNSVIESFKNKSMWEYIQFLIKDISDKFKIKPCGWFGGSFDWTEIYDDKYWNSKWIDFSGKSSGNARTELYRWLNKIWNLVIDTQFISENLKNKLIDNISNIDEKIQGLLIKSDNFTWLKILKNKYDKKIDCVIIDPPYNTENDRKEGRFLYKDNFIESSWCSFIENRIEISNSLLWKNSILISHIDENESHNLKLLLGQSLDFKTEFIYKKKTKWWKDDNDVINIIEHEPILVFWMKNSATYFQNLKDKDKINSEYKYFEEDWTRFKWVSLLWGWKNSLAHERPTMSFPIYIDYVTSSLYIPSQNIYAKKNKIFEKSLLEEVETFIKKWYKEISPYIKGKHWTWAIWFDKIKEIIEKKNYRITNINWEIKIENKMFCPTEDVFERYGSLILPEIQKNVLNSNATSHIKDLFPNYIWIDKMQPKSESISFYFLKWINDKKIILDFFVWTWTTASVSHKIWKKWIGITNNENNIFDWITLQRLKKVLEWEQGWISNEILWKGGWFFQYIELEQYEDVLQNINIINQENLSKEELKYIIKNNLLFSSSPSLLNSKEIFEKPFEQFINIAIDWQIIQQKVDLVETFNFLLWIEKENISFEDWWTKINGIKDWKKYLILWFKDGTLDSNKEIIENKNIIWETDFIYSNFEWILNDSSIKNISIYNEFKTLLF